MKATCIVGSARSNGSTAYLIDAMIKGMRQAGITTVKYNIGEQNIKYCLGCKACDADGTCVQQDDVHQIVSSMLGSDVVVIAAPSYWAGVPGQLKTLFDRTTPYGDTNPNRHWEHAIKGVAIAVRAGTHKEENELILDSIQHYLGHLGIKTVKRISVCETDSLEDLKTRHQDAIREAYEIGLNIAKANREK